MEDIDKLTANAVIIAHVLVTLAIGVGGGLVSVLMRRRRGRVASIKSTAVLAVAGADLRSRCVVRFLQAVGAVLPRHGARPREE